MALLPVIPGQLPSGFCGTSYQDILNEFSAHQSVDTGTGTGVDLIVSATKPTDESSAWLRLDSNGYPERIYWFAAGAWLSRHPLLPGSTIWYFNVLPDFTTFDGGDAMAESAISGPMWRQAKNSDGVLIAAKFPVAAGTLPSGAILAQGATGGEETHILTIPELPAHTHGMSDNFGEASATGNNSAIGQGLVGYDIGAAGPISEITNTTGGDMGHNNLPNYVVGYLIQRTPLRQFYTIT